MIVLGIMGRTPVAGVAWQALHYLDALRKLGHAVWYLEDTGTWPYNPETETDDCGYTVKYIARLMSWCDLADRWAFCDAAQGGRVHGCSELQLSTLLKEADAIINITGSSRLTERHLQIPVRVYLETDPGVPQIEMAQGNPFTLRFLAAHTHHFTYAENYGRADCRLPITPFDYRPTRQPVVMDWWQAPRADGQESKSDPLIFTTIASWKQSNDIVWEGELYTWSKDRQFMKFIDLPSRSEQSIELALACDDLDAIALLRKHGWHVSDALPLTTDIFPYRDFIVSSRGEFTVAKDQYARLRTGWFSDRSACYLAAGRPVITQNTGFGSFIPTGAGLFAFDSIEDILAAFDAIDSDYDKHSRAARAVAEECFRAEAVVGRMLDDLGF